MDLCQMSHEGLLLLGSCLRPHETLRLRDPVPSGPTWEGVYADDHLVLQKCTFKELASVAEMRDTAIVSDSMTSYLAHGAVVADEKQVRFRETATAWGSEVRGRRGLVGTCRKRRQQGGIIIFELVGDVGLTPRPSIVCSDRCRIPSATGPS